MQLGNRSPAVMKMKKGNKLLPFFILDEITSSSKSDGRKNLAAFQRNVFRVCGLVVIVMGTDSKVSNLVTPAGGSYSRTHRWMSLVPRFPSYQMMKLERDKKD